MLSFFKSTAAALCLSLGAMTAAPAAAATLLGTFTHDYGSAAGKVDPGGNDALFADFVRVSDQSTGRFSDAISFASLAYDTISKIVLTLKFSDAGPSGCVAAVGCFGENWAVRVQGSTAAASTDDFFAQLVDGLSPQAFTLTAGTDAGSVTAWANTLATRAVSFWFSEFTAGTDRFDLYWAKVEVYGTEPAGPAPIPLPAGGFLLLAGLAALGALRRKV
ncbi:MAG: VPLPA-CTERM sorting domain-containing protein [Gemmobacter sp.]